MSADPQVRSIVDSSREAHFRLGYLPALDGVRGISILAVMFLHGGLFWMGQGGFLGVDIFFVLSGFLITTLLMQEWGQTQTISFKNFYARRALRLLPALFVVICFCLLLVIIFPPEEGFIRAVRSVFIALFYLSNWLPVYKPLFHTWSLAIEEQFYILWPLVLFFLLRLKINYRVILVLLLIGVVLINVNRGLLWYHHTDATLVRVYTSLDTRSDTLLIGCMTGILISRNMIPRGPRARHLIRIMTVISALVMGFLIFSIPSTSSYLYYGGFTSVGVMVAIIITNFFYAPLNISLRVLEFPPLRWFGRLSYGLYLWHLPVYYLHGKVFPPFHVRSYTLSIMIPFVIKFLLAVGFASLSFYLVEQPVLRLKKRFRSDRAGIRNPVSLPPPILASMEESRGVRFHRTEIR